MNRFCLLTPALLFVLLSIWIPAAQAQNYQWAKGIGGSGFDQGKSIAVDGSGNVYTTGHFVGTITGEVSLTATGYYGLFVLKHDGSGNLIWAKSVDAASGTSLAVDGSGNVYITGTFYNTADFDPGAGNVELNPSEGKIFVLKLTTSGNFVWVKQLEELVFESGRMIAVDASGNAYTTSGGSTGILVNKLDGASGDLVWARSLDGVHYEFGLSIAVDGSGNVFTAGSFFDTVDFDPGPGTANLTSAGNVDIFIHLLDKDGNFLWVKQMGGPGEEDCQSVAVDRLGNIYTTGHFFSSDQGLADFDPGAGVAYLTGTGSGTIFISKLDDSGNFLWAREMGEENYNVGLSIALDASNNPYITGYFSGTTDFDPGDGIANLTTAENEATFICKLDQLGHYVWARQLVGTGDNTGSSVAVDGSNNVYTTGYFSGTADFDPGDGVANLTAKGSSSIFISKLEQVPIITGLTAMPNPVCTGSPVTLTATVSNLLGNAYSFTLTNGSSTISGSSSNPGFSQNLIASGSGTQSFTLTVTNNGQATSVITSLTVNPLPTPGLSNNGPLTCAQSSVTLTASGGTSYAFASGSGEWGIPGGSNTLVVSTPGTYSVRVTNVNGCTVVASSIVTSSTTLSVPGLSASATMTTNQPISVTATGCAGTINWVAQGGVGTETGTVYTFTQPGNYTLSASCSVGSCTSPTATPISLQILPGGFAIANVTMVNCSLIDEAKGSYQVQFTTQYSGQNANPISFSVVNELVATTNPAPYSLRLYSDNPAITLVADQAGNAEARYRFEWLGACQSGTSPNQAPITTGIPSQTILQNQPYQLQLTNYVSDPDQQQLTFSASGLPTGLTLNGSIISGAPSLTGGSSLTVVALDPGGLSVSTSFMLTVNPMLTTPAGFTIVGVSTVSCEVLSAGERRLTFTPQYAGVSGNPISFSVVNEKLPTTEAGPYSLNLYTDNPAITLSAQQGSVLATYRYNWLAVCNANSRLGVVEAGDGLQVRVLGNPVAGQIVELEIRGVVGQAVQLVLTDLQGRVVHQQRIAQAGSFERVSVPLESGQAVLLLNVSTARERQQLKLLKL